MRIKRFTYRNRRDFQAIFECEHCGHEKEDWGYDDRNFHDNVIPDMECPKCGKKANAGYTPLATRYPEGMAV